MTTIASEFEGKTEPDAMIRTWRYSGHENTLKQMLGEQTLPGTPPPWLLLLDRRTILGLEHFVSLLAAKFDEDLSTFVHSDLVDAWGGLVEQVDEELFGQIQLSNLLHYVMQQAYFEYTQNVYRQAMSIKRLDKQLDYLGSEYKRAKLTLERLERLNSRRGEDLTPPYVYKHLKTNPSAKVVRRTATNDARLVNLYTHRDLEAHQGRIREKIIQGKARIDAFVQKFHQCLRRHKDVEKNFDRILDALRDVANQTMTNMFLENTAQEAS